MLPVPSLLRTNGRDLPRVRHCLRAFDAEARRIADATSQFVRDVLTGAFPGQYLRKLLIRYAALQRKGGGAPKASTGLSVSHLHVARGQHAKSSALAASAQTHTTSDRMRRPLIPGTR